MRKLVAACTAVLIGLALGLIVVSNSNTNAVSPPTGAQPALDTPVATSHPVTSELFADVNNERVKTGLAPLAEDTQLDASAAAKCNDMVVKDYWSHIEPGTGQHAWHFIIEQGVSFQHAGENLAYGWPDSQSLVVGWMDSPGHRANIENPVYTQVGYAVCHSSNFVGEGPSDIVVQHLTD